MLRSLRQLHARVDRKRHGPVGTGLVVPSGGGASARVLALQTGFFYFFVSLTGSQQMSSFVASSSTKVHSLDRKAGTTDCPISPVECISIH